MNANTENEHAAAVANIAVNAVATVDVIALLPQQSQL